MTVDVAMPPAWTVVVPPGVKPIVVAGSRAQLRRLIRDIASLPPGQTVVLCDDRVGSRGRIHRIAQRSGMRLDAEYLALPTLRSSMALVEDRTVTLRWFWKEFATLPPGMVRLAGPISLGMMILGRTPAFVLRYIGPGRVVVGERQ